MRFLHGQGIHVEEIPEGTTKSAETIACDRCGRKWILMPRTGDVKTPVA
jgi:DNA-directed RNA polymerase subunit RPC12/RpoP